MRLFSKCYSCGDNANMDIAEIRRRNLRAWIDNDPASNGNVEAWCAYYSQFAEKPLTPSYVRQLAPERGKAVRNIGERAARKLEAIGRHPPGWLDFDHSSGSPAPPAPTPYELPPDYPLSPAVPAKPRALEDDAIPVRMHHVPVVGTTQGGPTTRVWTDGDLPAGNGFGWVSVSSRDRNAFALRVEGSSMAPRYEHGEYVLVEPNRRPEPGDDVIVRLCGGECMIKRLSARRPHELAFDSLSPGYDRITVAPDQIEYLYYVAAGLRAGSYVQHIQADGYVGPERRWHDEPVELDRRKDGEK